MTPPDPRRCVFTPNGKACDVKPLKTSDLIYQTHRLAFTASSGPEPSTGFGLDYLLLLSHWLICIKKRNPDGKDAEESVRHAETQQETDEKKQRHSSCSPVATNAVKLENFHKLYQRSSQWTSVQLAAVGLEIAGGFVLLHNVPTNSVTEAVMEAVTSTFGPVKDNTMVAAPMSPSVWMSPNDTLSNITDTKDDHMTDLAQDVFESVDAVLLGVTVVAVVVVILLLMIVVLRCKTHQKGTYYTNEEDLALKSDSDVQMIQEVQDIYEDSEEEES